MKTKLLIILVVSLLCLSGCGIEIQYKQAAPQGAPPATPSAAAAAAAVSAGSPSSVPKSPTAPVPPKYTVISEVFKQNDITIHYPQLRGLGDDAREKAVNSLIKSDILGNFSAPSTINNLTLELKFKVTFSTDELLSVLYDGTGYYRGTAHPNGKAYGFTINLKNAAKLYLSDFTPIDKNLVEKILQSKAITHLLEEKEPDIEFAGIVHDSIKRDAALAALSLQNRSAWDFCLTRDSLIIIVEVAHTMGDHALVKLPGLNAVSQESSIYDDFLSLRTETVCASFKIEHSSKLASICLTKGQNPAIVYRFGTPDNIELEFPVKREDSFKQFTYSEKVGGGIGEYHLNFINKGYQYDIIQTDNNNIKVNSIQIRVTVLSTGKVTDYIGEPDSLVGALYYVGDALTSKNSGK